MREHEAFGYDLLELRERFDRFEEGLEVVTRLLRSDEPVSFEGTYFRLKEAVLMPRPKRRDLPITIGGKGPKRTLGLVVKHAAEWNTPGMALEDFKALNGRLNRLLKRAGREPGSVRRSLMTSPVYGRDEEEVREKLGGQDVGELRALGEAGLDRVMLRWEDLDDAEGLREFGGALLPLL